MLARAFFYGGVQWDLDFSAIALSTSANSATIISALSAVNLTHARGSSATVQTSASTVVTGGIGNNVPRIGDRGSGRGYVHEPARTNYHTDSRVFGGTGWTAGGGAETVTANQSSPDSGSVLGDRMQIPSGNFPAYQGSITVAATKTTFSMWAKAHSGTETLNGYIDKAGTTSVINTSLSTTYQRVVSVNTATGTTVTVAMAGEARTLGAPQNFTAGARDIHFDLFGLENGAYATEAIATSGSSASRSADRLTHSDDRFVQATSGAYSRVTFEIKFIAKCALADLDSSTATLFASSGAGGAAGSATIDRSTGQIAVSFAGSTQTSTAGIAFSQYDVVEIWIEAGANTTTVVKYRVNGGSVTNLTSGSPVTHAPALAGGTMDLLSASGGGSNILPCWLQRITAYQYSGRPSWA